jgi:hypothetical protein
MSHCTTPLAGLKAQPGNEAQVQGSGSPLLAIFSSSGSTVVATYYPAGKPCYGPFGPGYGKDRVQPDSICPLWSYNGRGAGIADVSGRQFFVCAKGVSRSRDVATHVDDDKRAPTVWWVPSNGSHIHRAGHARR